MPRPTRLRALVAPSRSLSSLSFMMWLLPCSRLVHDTDEVAHLGDHAAHGRGVLQRGAPVHLVQAKADQRRALVGGAADGAADLLDNERLARVLCHDRSPL